MADYQQHGLYLHNWYRKHHGSPKMVLNDRLNQAADAYAYKLACRRQLVHTSGLDYNENLYMSTDTSLKNKKHVYKACEMWYNEKEYYNFNRGGFSMQTGHFTAMVWKESTQLGIGCGSANGCVVVVACYKPLANMLGQFNSNVLPWREVEDSEDEEEKKKKADEEEKKKKADEAEKKRQEEAQKKEAEEEEKNFSVENLPAPVQEAFASKADADSMIGWSELANILNDYMKIEFKFDGFDKTISSLLISMMTFRSGEKSRVGLNVLEDIWECVETFIKNYIKYDKDRSGTLDPFELKAALEESGFKISYKTFQTLQKQFGTEEGNMEFRQFVLCFILLAKLQAVQELKSDTGMFEDFSLKDWLQEQLDAVS